MDPFRLMFARVLRILLFEVIGPGKLLRRSVQSPRFDVSAHEVKATLGKKTSTTDVDLVSKRVDG
ncbi:hypothetical protein VP1G_10549 [Cytospora mali]|uniref:Uncharacterized protein n=1 Tax=Cytospora mali TaxID=578113 RepID=A0A194UMK2_CYTMA|nr:hypothetical protein VP1G_10549 [Valsa mali var. pyri (nom. inval.)]